MALAPREMIGADREQAGIFALRAGIRLHRDRVIAGDRAQLLREIVDQLVIAGGLINRSERVDLGKFRPGDRQHLGGAVQLHRAGAERDHRAIQRQIAIGEAAHVARHLAFGAVHLEDGMREDRRRPQQGFRQARGGIGLAIDEVLAAERGPYGLDDIGPRALVDGDADPVRPDLAQVDAIGEGILQDQPLEVADLHGDRVEERIRADGEAEQGQAIGQPRGVAMHALGDGAQAPRSVEHRVHGGDDRQQNLRGADVGGRFLVADVLLARLQREAVGTVALGIDGDADKPAGQRALVRVAGGHIGGMRAAKAHRHAVALHRAHRDIGAHFARRLQQSESVRIGRHDGDGARRVKRRDRRGKVMHGAAGARILKQRAEHVCRFEIGKGIADDDRPAERRGAGLHHGDRLGQAVNVDEERVLLRPRNAMRHGHRLRPGGRLVEQRGVGDIEPGEVAYQGLKIQQRLEPALADLGLVGGIGGVPGRVLENVALDRGRHGGAVIALADQRDEQRVLVRDLAHLFENAALGKRNTEVDTILLPDVGRQRLVDQRMQARRADDLEHRRDLARRRADVPAVGEIIGIVCVAGHGCLSRSGNTARIAARKASAWTTAHVASSRGGGSQA